MVFSAWQTNSSSSPVSSHHFCTAASFHSFLTACRGMTRHASLQSGTSKSMGGAFGCPTTSSFSVRTWCSWTRPCLRWSKKSLQVGSVTRICSVLTYRSLVHLDRSSQLCNHILRFLSIHSRVTPTVLYSTLYPALVYLITLRCFWNYHNHSMFATYYHLSCPKFIDLPLVELKQGFCVYRCTSLVSSCRRNNRIFIKTSSLSEPILHWWQLEKGMFTMHLIFWQYELMPIKKVNY